jgi:hypothetical protein
MARAVPPGSPSHRVARARRGARRWYAGQATQHPQEAFFPLGRQLPQWPLIVRVIARIEDLDSSVVLAIERDDRSRASRLDRVVWGVEPQPEMEGVNWPRLGIGISIRNRIMMEHGGRSCTRAHNILMSLSRFLSGEVIEEFAYSVRIPFGWGLTGC